MNEGANFRSLDDEAAEVVSAFVDAGLLNSECGDFISAAGASLDQVSDFDGVVRVVVDGYFVADGGFEHWVNPFRRTATPGRGTAVHFTWPRRAVQW